MPGFLSTPAFFASWVSSLAADQFFLTAFSAQPSPACPAPLFGVERIRTATADGGAVDRATVPALAGAAAAFSRRDDRQRQQGAGDEGGSELQRVCMDRVSCIGGGKTNSFRLDLVRRKRLDAER